MKFKVARRKKAFEAQLPEALSLIASSLQAGHTALRSVQSMVEESEAAAVGGVRAGGGRDRPR